MDHQKEMPKALKAFIVYSTYRIENSKAYVHLYGRLENGESFQSIHAFKPYFFIKTQDKIKAEALLTQLVLDGELKLTDGMAFSLEDTTSKNFDEEPMTKVTLWIPGDVKPLRGRFEQQLIKCYEADIRFTTRFMIDKGIQGACTITGAYKQGKSGSGQPQRIYHDPAITPLTEEERETYFPQLKILSVDIETTMDAKQLLCISLYTEEFENAEKEKGEKEKVEKVIMITQQQLNGVVAVPDEKTLLEVFLAEVKKIDPDVIVGWNFIDFDLVVLRDLFRKHKIPFALGRSDEEAKINIQTSFFVDSKADIPGRQVLDGIQLLKGAFIKMENYKLNTAAKKFLGQEKLITGEARHEEIQRLYQEDQQQLADYNLKDAKLAYDVLFAAGVMPLTIHRSLLTGMSLDRVNASIASLDFVYLKETQKRGLVAQGARGSDAESEERIKGGHVLESKPGIYKNILVFDFKSLYPSLIRTFNIDPYRFLDKTSKRYKALNEEERNALIKAPNGACFMREQGILPQILETLWKNRDKAKKQKNDLASYAIKILMNSMFGVLANPTCRFYSLDMANAITHFGQHFIKLTAKRITEKGYEVIGGDTDSIFVNTKKDSTEEAEHIGKDIAKEITASYQQFVEQEYQRKSYLELQFEKTYVKFLLPRVRGSEKGAKKRYAGILMKEGKEALNFVGLEVVRRDWTALAKKFQTELLERVFHEKDVTGYVRDFVKDIKKGTYDDLLVYRKSLRKGVADYTKTTPPHVKAARQLEKIDGDVIEYYITTQGPEPVQKRRNPIDYQHYIDKQVKPLADSILGFYGSSFDDLVRGDNQKSLFSY